jgi:hypothetical protein
MAVSPTWHEEESEEGVEGERRERRSSGQVALVLHHAK